MPTNVDQRMTSTCLDRAVAEFGSNPMGARLIRRMASQLPNLFLSEAVKYLESRDESAAHRLLASMMLRHPLAHEEIADPARGTLERSVTLFTRLWKVDPSFDVKLARRLPDRHGLNHCEAFDAPRSYRVLDVLDETSTGRRLVPVLGHLIESADLRIAAKATLFIGKRIQSAEWAARQLTRNDPSVRANAVESIWGLKSPTAQTLLEFCTGDSSSHVAGNALVGLHKLGKPGIVEQINSMVNGATHNVRSTAAWTMGRIGDSAFVDSLTELLRDDHPEVRGAALRSLLQIRKAEAAAPVINAPVVEQVSEAVAPPGPETAPEAVEETDEIDMDIRPDDRLGAAFRYRQVG
jgi:HEAT repeats